MSIIVFLLVFLVPLGVYLFNAYSARRPTGIAGGIDPPKKAKTVKPRRARTTPRGRVTRNCGRDWTHLCLVLVGARDGCRWCQAPTVEPVPFPGTGPDDGDESDGEDGTPRKEPLDIIAEAERILGDSRKE